MGAPTRPCAGPCGRNRSEKFFTGPKGTVCTVCQREARRKALRAHRMRNVYELEPDEYQALHDAQDGKCAVCKQPRQYLLHVEHDHAIEKERGARASIRGLACKRCNNLLRDARDNAQLLRMCADYLENPPAQKILAALQSGNSCELQSDAPSETGPGSSRPGSITSSEPLRRSA